MFESLHARIAELLKYYRDVCFSVVVHHISSYTFRGNFVNVDEVSLQSTKNDLRINPNS